MRFKRTNNRKHNQNFEYGSLEQRKLLAGVVWAGLSGSDLVLIGDAESNHVEINLEEAGHEDAVKGFGETEIMFSKAFIDAFANDDYTGLKVQTNAGHDTVIVCGTVVEGDVRLELGAGHDGLFVLGTDENPIAVGGNLWVAGHSGIDSAFVQRVDVAGNFRFNGHRGSDDLMLDVVNIAGNAAMFGEMGADNFSLTATEIVGRTGLIGSSGKDFFAEINSDFGQRMRVDGQADFDTCYTEESVGPDAVLNGVERNLTDMSTNLRHQMTFDRVGNHLFEKSEMMPSVMANKLQNRLTGYSDRFDLDFIEFELDADVQVVSVLDPTRTISVVWDQAVQTAVANEGTGPTIGSRAYAMMHTAMYDAWSAYDATAVSTQLGDDLQRPQSENNLANKTKAMSYAAYRVLEDLFAEQVDIFDDVMADLEFSPDNRSTNTETAVGIGNRMAEALLEVRHNDGSNQLGEDSNGEIGTPYSDVTGYEPRNSVGDPETMDDWTPEFVPIDDQSGSTQQFLTPHWGQVDSFSLASGSEFRPDAPQPFLLVDGTVNLDAKTITLADGATFDIDRSIIGTIINPEFVSQAEHVVELSAGLTDEQKLIAEFWEDGGGTPFPPGTFMTFGQFVSARDNHSLDDDAKMFFALGNAVFDAGVATWEAKVHYDYVRPVRAIRELGELGLIGEFDSELGGYAIDAWVEGQGTQTILASEFLTYQTPGRDPSPPFSEYTSGHSAFSAAGATVLQMFTGSDLLDAHITFPAGSSRFESGLTPAADLTLSWDTFSTAADEAGESRLYGGIHFVEGDVNGREVGKQVGMSAWDRAQEFINGDA